MRRFEELKRLDIKTRNKLRSILSASDDNVISNLSLLRSKLGKSQSSILDAILNQSRHEKAVQGSSPFPKRPPFYDTLHPQRNGNLKELLNQINSNIFDHSDKILSLCNSLQEIDEAYAHKAFDTCRELIAESIERYGWSHAILRRIVLIRENLPDGQDDNKLEELLEIANISLVAVSSVIHSYSLDQSILTIKKSILNMADRGVVNRYSRAISRLPVQPFCKSEEDLFLFLSEVEKCSLIDAIILAKFNQHLFSINEYPLLLYIASTLGQSEVFEKLIATYDESCVESEYTFFKQSSAWLEYNAVREYRILLDHYFDASREEISNVHENLENVLLEWVGDADLRDLVGSNKFTKHTYSSLTKLEISGFATRSAIFNYWLYKSEGQIGFEKDDLLKLMGLTRDLARTVPIKATRTAAKLTQDKLVRLILLLLLAKRSKNELDFFNLRKLLEEIAIKDHSNSLVNLVKFYEKSHPYVAEYIYEIATEDFLAKLNKIAPHRADIPEIRASLHEWMAGFRNDEHFLQRARAVRIDHQLNRVRNEIDDHRIYVDPSRFSSWLEDEMMIDLNSALTSTGTGKKGVAINCDETLLNLIMTQSYNTFCSNSVFGIASYIGRRIRHGTFHGHLYSSVVNSLEQNQKFNPLFINPNFLEKWNLWKNRYNRAIDTIIRDRLHVYSKSKPLGLLQPEIFGPGKQEILSAAIKNISTNFVETTTIEGIDQTIIDYCWRLAESDLINVTKFLRAQQTSLKDLAFFEEAMSSIQNDSDKLIDVFQRELALSIDRKLAAMFGWFKRPTIVAPKASVNLLFNAIVAEVRDTLPYFALKADDPVDVQNIGETEDEVVGGVYHLVYDSLAIVVSNAAKHGDPCRPPIRKFKILQGKPKRLVVEITSFINPLQDVKEVSLTIEQRKKADFQDANLYQGKSGISKLMLLAQQRQDFTLEQYAVVGSEVKVKISYDLEH